MSRPLSMLGAAILFAELLSGCGPKPAPPPAPLVYTSKPLQRRVMDWDEYVGRFEAVNSVDVRPRVSGYLVFVGFKDGQMVDKGQLLFEIDPRPYRAALDQARAQVDRSEAALGNARSQATRGEALIAARAISQQEFDTLTAAEKQAEADLAASQALARTAALNFSFTRVIAPMAGRVSDRRVAPGNLVTADQTVLTNIVTLDPMRFSFEGSEGIYLKYERQNAAGGRTSSRYMANPVEIQLQDEPTYRWKGRMEFVDNALDVNSGTIRGRALVANPDHFLTPGMFGHMRLLGSSAYQALLVPDVALVADQARQVVYIVGNDGVVALREVQTGPLFGDLRVIRAGITAQDSVIISGVQRAKPGKKVQVKETPIAPPPALAAAAGDDYTKPEAPSVSLADSAR
jgi:RND family efflux transporter MFP subunit